MAWHRTTTPTTTTAGTPPTPPPDPVGEAVAETLVEMLAGAEVELRYEPDDEDAGTGEPRGWRLTVALDLDRHLATLVDEGVTSLADMVDALAPAATRVADRYRGMRPPGDRRLAAPLRRAIRDDIAADVLGQYLSARTGDRAPKQLIADTIDFLVELSGTRVESHDLTHGVLVADVFDDDPRLEFRYPDDIREAKRAPLLFDGQRSVLVVDTLGRARSELQRHRFAHTAKTGDALDSGALLAMATRVYDGLGFFLRGDRTIWTYVAGRPVLVRRGEHWTAFPLSLSASVTRMIGGGAHDVADTVVRAAFAISAQPRGAILAIVDDPATLDDVVPAKDRYDRRDDVDPSAMRPETRLHHLIDAGADDLDEHTLVRLAELDGATILDRDGRLLAYGAIVTSSDSEHEGARTAAARTLSERALVVLKVSVDGDITVFRGGRAVTTLLGRTAG